MCRDILMLESQVTGACFDLVLTSRKRPSDMLYATTIGTRDNENRLADLFLAVVSGLSIFLGPNFLPTETTCYCKHETVPQYPCYAINVFLRLSNKWKFHLLGIGIFDCATTKWIHAKHKKWLCNVTINSLWCYYYFMKRNSAHRR